MDLIVFYDFVIKLWNNQVVLFFLYIPVFIQKNKNKTKQNMLNNCLYLILIMKH